MFSLIFSRGLEEFSSQWQKFTTQKWPKTAILKGFHQKIIFCPSPRRLRYVFYGSTHENKHFKIKNGWKWVEMRVGCYENRRFHHSWKMEIAPITSQVTQNQLKWLPIDLKWSETLEKVLKLSFLTMLKSKNYQFHSSK